LSAGFPAGTARRDPQHGPFRAVPIVGLNRCVFAGAQSAADHDEEDGTRTSHVAEAYRGEHLVFDKHPGVERGDQRADAPAAESEEREGHGVVSVLPGADDLRQVEENGNEAIEGIEGFDGKQQIHSLLVD
jgi:hypothetical protein